MKESIAGLSAAYGEKVIKYKSINWNIAVFYRLAIMRRIFAQNLYDLPMPAGLTPEEDTYTGLIEEIAVPIEDEAVRRLETAYQKAKGFRIANEWTRKILAVLNLYKPTEYPTFKDEKRLETPSVTSTSGFLLPKEASAADSAEGAAPGEPDTAAPSQSDATPEARSKSLGKRSPKEATSTGTTPDDVNAVEAERGVQPEKATSAPEATTSPDSEDGVEPLEDLEEITE